VSMHVERSVRTAATCILHVECLRVDSVDEP